MLLESVLKNVSKRLAFLMAISIIAADLNRLKFFVLEFFRKRREKIDLDNQKLWPERARKSAALLFEDHWKVTSRLGVGVVAVMGLMVLLGTFLDGALGTGKIFFLIGIVAALPISIVVNYRVISNLVKK